MTTSNRWPGGGVIVVSGRLITTRQAWRAGAPIRLRRLEFDLLWVLMENAGKAIPRRELLAQVWGKEWAGSPRTLDVHTCAGAGICWLREKLEENPSAPRYIQTLRGYGHRFVSSPGR